MSCCSIVCEPQNTEGEHIFKRHMHHNPKTADIMLVFF